MIARSDIAFRALLALLASLAISTITNAQDELIWVEVGNYTSKHNTLPEALEAEDIEKRYTPELVEELNSAKSDALLLYTEYSAKSGSDLKNFLKNVSSFSEEVIRSVNNSGIYDDEHCREIFESKLHKIENNAQRAAHFSGENHHKFLLGHMIVFRMHLNKSEDYIKKCDNAVKNCGVSCETTPRVKRWRRLAAEEIHRVRDDLQHSRRSYRDLVAHGRRKLNHLRKQIVNKAKDAVEQYHECVRQG